jgi:hypothetical protein
MRAPQTPSSEAPIPRASRVALLLGAWGLTLLGLQLVTNAPPATVVFFPVGLFVFFLGASALHTVVLAVGWGLYAVLTISLLRTQRWRTFFILFALLGALLMLNFAGCSGLRHYPGHTGGI